MQTTGDVPVEEADSCSVWKPSTFLAFASVSDEREISPHTISDINPCGTLTTQVSREVRSLLNMKFCHT